MINEALLDAVGLGMSESDRFHAAVFRALALDQPGVVSVNGMQGSGKSAFATMVGHTRKRLFGFPTVSNTILKAGYGDFSYIDRMVLADELEMVNKAVNEAVAKKRANHLKAEELDQIMAGIWERSGTKLKRSSILIDEGGEQMEKRRSGSPLNLAYGYVVQRFRHYESLIVVCCTTKSLLDDYRFNPFITHDVLCEFFVELKLVHCNVYWRRGKLIDGVNPMDIWIDIRNWADKFDSWAPIAVDPGLLRGLRKGARL